MIKGAIFDLDDTIAQSKSAHYKAWDKALEKYNKKYSDIPEKVRGSFIGMRISDMTQGVIDSLQIQATAKDLYEARMKAFFECVKTESKLLPGVAHALTLCKSLSLKCAVSSSGVREYINLFLEQFSIKQYFDAIISGDDVKEGKPHPESYLLACKKLDLKPADCVVFEDSQNGVLSAKSAGCKCIAIPYKKGISQDLSSADVVIDSLSDLNSEILKNL